MRKLANEAKRYTKQKITKKARIIRQKIEKLKERQQQSDDSKLKDEEGKLNHQLSGKQKLLTNLNKLDKDLISKQALSHDLSHFNSLVAKVCCLLIFR